MRFRILLAVLVTVAICRTAPAEFPLTAKPEAVEAWKDMRFGMFVCWGPVSLTGKEIGWSRGAPEWGRRKGMRGGKGPTPAKVYDELYTKWKPDKFDAEQWVKIAKDAGQQIGMAGGGSRRPKPPRPKASESGESSPQPKTLILAPLGSDTYYPPSYESSFVLDET